MKSPGFLKRKVFINKKFQTDFAVRFLALIVLEALIAVALFYFFSKDTVITGVVGSEIVVERASSFMPLVLMANVAIIGVTAIAGFIVLLYSSHRVAGPLFRFERILDEVANGDLTLKVRIRASDELGETALKISDLCERLDKAVSTIKSDAASIKLLNQRLTEAARGGDIARVETLVKEASERLQDLERSAGYFKTTGTGKG